MSMTKKFAVALAGLAGLGLVLAGPTQIASAAPAPEPGATTGYAVPSDTTVNPLEGVEETDPGLFAASGVKYGGTITRANVLKRAKNWYTRNVPYNQSAYAWDINHGKKYRTDCSGFVSMSWALTSSRTTSTLSGVSKKIAWSSLKPGDIVLRKGHHVMLFEKWTSSAHTSFWIYEEGSTASDMNHRKVTVKSAKADKYVPYRYNKIK